MCTQTRQLMSWPWAHLYSSLCAERERSIIRDPPCDLLGEKVITAGMLSPNCIKLFFTKKYVIVYYTITYVSTATVNTKSQHLLHL